MNHPLAVYARKYVIGQEANGEQVLLQLIPAVHQCNVQRVAKYRSLPIETRKTKFGDLLKDLPDRVMASVKSWTNNRCGIVSLDLFPDDESHWSIRTIKNRKTSFKNDEEMMDFIRSANSSTVELFNVYSQSKENGYKSTYFIAVIPIAIPS
jgi:hypothetical protein